MMQPELLLVIQRKSKNERKMSFGFQQYFSRELIGEEFHIIGDTEKMSNCRGYIKTNIIVCIFGELLL